MIAKGTRHDNGAKLARYLITGKQGERAELWQLRGFEAQDIQAAFRDVHIMADAIGAAKPFFHVQVRNREGETLTRHQWEITAHRIMRINGLSGQPHAIAFHTDELTGEEHMHLAVSLIDEQSMRLKPLPFFKLRLKDVCRELEKELDLTRVKNERDGEIKSAPTRAEEEQARRLNVDIHAIRNTMRSCYDRSDCGRSFNDALAHEALILAEGEGRSGYVVIDHAGGLHALGKKVLGVTVSQVRDKLADLDRDQIPTIEQAREFLLDLPRDRIDRLTRELSAVQKQIEAERDYARRDPVREDMAWHDAVAKAAIEKEKIERRFADPKPEREDRAGNREKEWPIHPPQPEPINTSARYHFEDAAREATRPAPAPLMPEKLRGAAAHIWMAYHNSCDVETFARILDGEHGISLAAATKEEADQSHKLAAFAKEVGNFAPEYRQREIVAITEQGHVYQLSRRTTGEDRASIERFLKPLNRQQLQGIDATKETLKARVEQRDIEVQAFRDMLRDGRTAERMNAAQKAPRPARQARSAANNNIHSAARTIGKGPLRTLGGTLDVVSRAFDSLLATPATPEQKHDAKEARLDREAEAAATIDFSQYTAKRAVQEQQAARDRQRERERER